MAPSDNLIEFLKAWEGPPHFTPQLDPCNSAVHDIGYGHVCTPTTPAITDEQAVQILRDDAASAAVGVRTLVHAAIKQNEFDALTSFTFNLGRGALAGSTLLRMVNAGDKWGAAGQFGRWIYAAGRPIQGLIKRREAERKMFLDADYSQRP